jgi:hypothetical protein
MSEVPLYLAVERVLCPIEYRVTSPIRKRPFS